jgi:predicted branched-subunit amino acid permease
VNWTGYRDALPFFLIVVPFGTLFGVVGTEAGLTLLQTMAFSTLVVAGASQFTAIAMLIENAPVAIALFTAIAVNLRMVMYSAALVPHFGRAPLGMRALLSYFLIDQTFAIATHKFAETPGMNISQKMAYFSGAFWFMMPVWIVSTYVGAVFGKAIPPEYALDFAVPICFLALSAPAMRNFAFFMAGVTSIVVTLALAFVPFKLGLMIAAVFAMIVGVQTENWMERRKT